MFGQTNCLNPNVLGQMIKDNNTPMKLCALVFCDTVDELYHGLYDVSLISALRTLVFAGIVADASRKTVENIIQQDEAKVENIIQKYLDFKNQKL